MSYSLDDTHSSSNNNVLDNKTERPYALILYGATSFVGQITARYLARFLSGQEHQDIKWAIAGRSVGKLEKLEAQLIKEHNIKIDMVLADSDDAASLDKMTAQTKVIISTVGPYLKYGEPLIKSCVEHGTDYVDLTGEAIFIKDMLDKYQDKAQQSGARIVNSCGFDSIPSDLGVYFTQQQSEAMFNAPCDTIHMRVKSAKGGLSGGTLASMAAIFAEAGQNKARRQQLTNPYLLNTDNNAPSVHQDSINKPQYDAEHGRWLAPFIMASINTRIVHRSNQLLSYEYGREFKYDEAMWMQDGVKGQLISYGLSAGIMGFVTAMTFKRSREFLTNHVLTKSGDGPSQSEQDNGYFDVRFFGKTANNDTITTKVTGNKDPGYGSTSQMLAQSALCLAQDIPKDDIEGGFWTPASAMGEKLIQLLKNHAGITFEVIESQNGNGS